MEKRTQKLVVLQWSKKFQVLEKKILKRFFQLISTDKTYKMVCGNFFEINGSQDTLTFGDFLVPNFWFPILQLLIKLYR